jgi:hypothetical protein
VVPCPAAHHGEQPLAVVGQEALHRQVGQQHRGGWQTGGGAGGEG